MKLSMKNTFWEWLGAGHGPSGTCVFLRIEVTR